MLRSCAVVSTSNRPSSADAEAVGDIPQPPHFPGVNPAADEDVDVLAVGLLQPPADIVDDGAHIALSGAGGVESNALYAATQRLQHPLDLPLSRR